MDRISQTSKALLVALCVSVMALSATSVSADETVKETEYCVTEYGGKRKCETTTEKTVTEEVTHETTEIVHDTSDINAGIGDISFYMIAGVAGSLGAALFIFSKLTQGVYLLD